MGRVEEVDDAAWAAAERDAVIAFERAMWEEHAPGEPQLSEDVAMWMRTRERANVRKATWVARTDDGETAGVATLGMPSADNLHLGHLELRVLPWDRRNGFGRDLLREAARRAAEDGRTTLVGTTWDIVPAGEAFALAFGAEPKQVVRRSDLDLTSIDRDLIARWLAVPDAASDLYELWFMDGAYPPDQYEAIAEVEEVMNTAPHDDLALEAEVRDADWVAQREREFANTPGDRWTIFVRERATGRLVGYTQVFLYPDWPGHVDQGNTGVHPDHRGHGLGRWLKAAMIDHVLRERPDSFRVRTTNAFSNAPMLAINDAMGFVVTAAATAWEASVEGVLGVLGPEGSRRRSTTSLDVARPCV